MIQFYALLVLFCPLEQFEFVSGGFRLQFLIYKYFIGLVLYFIFLLSELLSPTYLLLLLEFREFCALCESLVMKFFFQLWFIIEKFLNEFLLIGGFLRYVYLYIVTNELFLLFFFILLLVIILSSNFLCYFFNMYYFIGLAFCLFIYVLISENCSKKLYYFYFLILILFLEICFFNYLGMIPYIFTVTSHIIFTLNYSFLFFIGLNILSILLHGFTFVTLFLPSGAPLLISAFLILIEFISYSARVFSLAIRLFANLMSGHTLLTILSGFSFNLFVVGGIFFCYSLFIMGSVCLIIGLESAIAFLQAYVFCVLVIIYFNDALSVLTH